MKKPAQFREEGSRGILPVILLVEDHPMIQTIHSSFLCHLGYSVEIAATGQQAIKLFKNRSYAALLLDIGLPDLEGTGVCRILRQHEQEQQLPPVPIIALTSDPSVKSACLSAGCNDFFLKPIALETLDSLLKRWICSKKPLDNLERALSSFPIHLIDTQNELRSC